MVFRQLNGEYVRQLVPENVPPVERFGARAERADDVAETYALYAEVGQPARRTLKCSRDLYISTKTGVDGTKP